jgi:hypothetical protein
VIAISTSTIVFVLFVVPALGFALYLWLHDALVRIDAGEVGLVEVRGRPTDRVLLPGTHLVVPFGRMTIHPYPTRELVFRTTRDARSDDDADPTTDPPIGVVLGDRSHAEVCFTVRFRLDVDQLRSIHLRIGPSGVFELVRDVSERQLGDSLADSSITYDDVFGTQRVTLENRLQDDLTSVLAEHGIVVTFFGLREIDLGEVGVAVQAAARCTGAGRTGGRGSRGPASPRRTRPGGRRPGRRSLRCCARLPQDPGLEKPDRSLGRAHLGARHRPEPCSRRSTRGRGHTMNVNAEHPPASERDFRDRAIEVLTVVLLGVATVASAWCAYQASRWNGIETDEARATTEARVEQARLFATGTQVGSYDSNVLLAYAQAVAADQPTLAEFIRTTLMRPEFEPVLETWEQELYWSRIVVSVTR